jgi:hypothetical protein
MLLSQPVRLVQGEILGKIRVCLKLESWLFCFCICSSVSFSLYQSVPLVWLGYDGAPCCLPFAWICCKVWIRGCSRMFDQECIVRDWNAYVWKIQYCFTLVPTPPHAHQNTFLISILFLSLFIREFRRLGARRDFASVLCHEADGIVDVGKRQRRGAPAQRFCTALRWSRRAQNLGCSGTGHSQGRQSDDRDATASNRIW